MTLKMILDALNAAGIPAYELKAPERANSYVVGHSFAPRTLNGDDCSLVRIDRVQLDIVWPESSPGFYDRVCNVLDKLWQIYETEVYGYDDDFRAMRAILQMEVV